MPLTNAQHQAASRARRTAKLEALTALANAVLTELANSNTDKGKRLHAMAWTALNPGEGL